jgi:hypothetical protein
VTAADDDDKSPVCKDRAAIMRPTTTAGRVVAAFCKNERVAVEERNMVGGFNWYYFVFAFVSLLL